MTFKTMDPEVIRTLIEGVEDVITPVAEMESKLYESCSCPVCGCTGADKTFLEPKVIHDDTGFRVLRAPFNPNSPTVQGHAKCRECQTEYNPMTGVIIRAPNGGVIDPRAAQL